MLILTHSWEISLFSNDKYKKNGALIVDFTHAERSLEYISVNKKT